MFLRLPDSWSNLNLEMLVFEERGKPEYPEKNLSEQGREPTTNSTHIWRRRRELNPGHPCSPRELKSFTAISILLTAISIFSRQHSRHFSLRSPPVNFGGRQWPPKVKTQNQKSIFNVDLQNEKWKSKSKSRFTNTYVSRQWVDNRRVYWSRKIVSFIPGGEGLRIWKGWGCSSEILN